MQPNSHSSEQGMPHISPRGQSKLHPIACGKLDNELRQHFYAGDSDRAISQALNCSQRQVTRRRTKLGLDLKNLPREVKAQKYRTKPPAQKKAPPQNEPVPTRRPSFVVGNVSEPDFPPAPEGQPFCHWPIGAKELRNFRFCHASAVRGKSYCEHHLRRSRPQEV